MAHSLPPLPYAFDALEPSIDALTMQIHHGKHHQAYVNNLNAALEKAPEVADKSVEDLISNLNGVPEAVRTAVRNNGGGHGALRLGLGVAAARRQRPLDHEHAEPGQPAHGWQEGG